MNIRERIIQFQNTAEANFQRQKTLKTSALFVLAMLTFLISNFWALFGIPFRYVLKTRKDKNTINANSHNLGELLNRKNLTLLDFWAPWCGPCIMMNPILEEFSRERSDIKIVKINADANTQLLKQYSVKGIPHFVLLKGEKELKRHAGPMTKKDLINFCQLT